VKRLSVKPGAAISLQYHNRRAEHWVVVGGLARIRCGDEDKQLVANQSTYIPVGAEHQLENNGDDPLVVIEVQTGDYLGEDDIVRLEDRYGRD
jgi:mannose-6-phosphate isomerase-like protein (cupin superfamily)